MKNYKFITYLKTAAGDPISAMYVVVAMNVQAARRELQSAISESRYILVKAWNIP